MSGLSVPAVAVIGNLVRDIVGGTPPRPGGAVFYQARVFEVRVQVLMAPLSAIIRHAVNGSP